MAIQPSLTDRSACASRSGSGRPQRPAYCSSSSCVSRRSAAPSSNRRLPRRSFCASEKIWLRERRIRCACGGRRSARNETSSAASPPESRCTSSRMNQTGGLPPAHPAPAPAAAAACAGCRVAERTQLRRQLRRGVQSPAESGPEFLPSAAGEKLPEQIRVRRFGGNAPLQILRGSRLAVARGGYDGRDRQRRRPQAVIAGVRKDKARLRADRRP